MNIKLIVFFLVLFFSLGCSRDESDKTELPENQTEKLFRNFIALHPDTVVYKTEEKSYKWNYEQGLVLEAFYRMWKLSGEEKYYSYLKKNVDYYVEPDGKINTYKLEDFNLDNIAPGRQLLHLYSITKEEKYKKAADLLMQQLQNQPKTIEGGYWHKQRYPFQMWLDGLYMAEPFYAEYAVMFNQSEYFDEIAKQFLLVQKCLKDENTGLYYHAYDESREQKWADAETGQSPNFWGRSVGWFMMAMVDVLDYFPENHPDRTTIQNMFKDLSITLLKYRDKKTGLWYQVIDKGDQKGNYIETSASLMIIYSFAKGANNGILSPDYLQVAQESIDAVYNNYLTIDGNGLIYLQNTVSVGGLGGDPYRDGSFEYYISEPIRINDFKGYGPLMLAAIEIKK